MPTGNFKQNAIALAESLVYERGYLFCEWCGTSQGGFEPHHIVYRSEAPGHKKLHDKLNIINLCLSCHKKAHSNKKKYQPLLQKLRGGSILTKENVN